jgi:hypothetical protein
MYIFVGIFATRLDGALAEIRGDGRKRLAIYSFRAGYCALLYTLNITFREDVLVIDCAGEIGDLAACCCRLLVWAELY